MSNVHVVTVIIQFGKDRPGLTDEHVVASEPGVASTTLVMSRLQRDLMQGIQQQPHKAKSKITVIKIDMRMPFLTQNTGEPGI